MWRPSLLPVALGSGLKLNVSRAEGDGQRIPEERVLPQTVAIPAIRLSCKRSRSRYAGHYGWCITAWVKSMIHESTGAMLAESELSCTDTAETATSYR